MDKCVLAMIIMLVVPVVSFAEGEVAGLNDFEYWDNGRTKQCTVYDKDGRIKAKAFCRHSGKVDKIEKYDLYGNKIEEVLYDDKGKLRRGIDGWAAMRWRYNEDRLVAQISYDEYGKPIDKRYYSESGRLIGRQFVDSENLNPYEEANMYILLGVNNIRYEDKSAPAVGND